MLFLGGCAPSDCISDSTKWWHADKSCGGETLKPVNSGLVLDRRRLHGAYGRKFRYSLKEPLGRSQEQALTDQHDFELALVENFERLSQDVYEGSQNGRMMRLDRQVQAKFTFSHWFVLT